FTNNKGFAEDLTEGKFSYPVIHYIQTSHHKINPNAAQTQLTLASITDPTSRQLFNILKQRTTDVELKRYAIRIMQSTLDGMKQELLRREDEARTETARLGGNPELEKIIDYLGVAYQ
ncbi:hypothetical protein HK100_011299, partial [Physocladia obscura]